LTCRSGQPHEPVVARQQIQRRDHYAGRLLGRSWRPFAAAVGTLAPAPVVLGRFTLEAGYEVFLEKPLGVSEAECDEVIEASGRTGRLVALRVQGRAVGSATGGGQAVGGDLPRCRAGVAHGGTGPPE
jgi:hypothetical protein